MPNAITLFKKCLPLLDEVYKNNSCTAPLDSPASIAREGANANEILIPKLSMQGLGDYDRTNSKGYKDGTVTMEFETKKFNYDRGRKFSVDAMDNEETAGLAFGQLSAEFMRAQVVPELDAFRFSKMAELAKTKKEEDIQDGAALITAITAGVNALDEGEVPMDGRFLFVTPTLKTLIDNLDTTKSRQILDGLTIVKVPQSRFYTTIDLKTGGSGEETGGYTKDPSGKDLNFVLVHPSALIQFEKHVVPKIITPEQNQDSDAWIFAFRAYGLSEVYDNKKGSIYVSHKTT